MSACVVESVSEHSVEREVAVMSVKLVEVSPSVVRSVGFVV